MYHTKGNRNVNYGLWVVVMCQDRFINSNKHTFKNGGNCAMAWNTCEISVPSQFCLDPKTALKKLSS